MLSQTTAFVWWKKTGESNILLVFLFKKCQTTVEHPTSFGEAGKVKLKAEQFYNWPEQSEWIGYFVGLVTGQAQRELVANPQ